LGIRGIYHVAPGKWHLYPIGISAPGAVLMMRSYKIFDPSGVMMEDVLSKTSSIMI
jgi:hypothetical protein